MNASAEPGNAILARRPAWRTVNITPAERAGRIAVGLAAVAAGIVMPTGASAALAVALELLLLAAGLDLAVTGALGHCPLYTKLGYLPKSLRRTRTHWGTGAVHFSMQPARQFPCAGSATWSSIRKPAR